jgi:hypothetical protein
MSEQNLCIRGEKAELIYREIPLEIIHETVEAVLPYYEMNDDGHQIDHAVKVTETALHIVETMYPSLFEILKPDIFLAGMLHDIMASERQDHHLLGCMEAYANPKIMEIVNKYSISTINVWYAILEHRASYQGNFSSIVSSIISAADRNKPDIEEWVTRVKKGSVNDDMESALDHIKIKMGKGGYARIPAIYKTYYGRDMINKFHADIEDREKMIEIWNRV